MLLGGWRTRPDCGHRKTMLDKVSRWNYPVQAAWSEVLLAELLEDTNAE